MNTLQLPQKCNGWIIYWKCTVHNIWNLLNSSSCVRFDWSLFLSFGCLMSFTSNCFHNEKIVPFQREDEQLEFLKFVLNMTLASNTFFVSIGRKARIEKKNRSWTSFSRPLVLIPLEILEFFHWIFKLRPDAYVIRWNFIR